MQHTTHRTTHRTTHSAPQRPVAVRSIAFALALGLATAACARDTSQIQSAEAHQLVERGALLLDVRSAVEYGASHIDGAQNISVMELEGRLNELPRDRPIIVYCHSGARSARAAEMLRAQGFQVRDLGPMAAW